MLRSLQKCLQCGGSFQSKNKNHSYCKRSCFKKAYNKRKELVKFPSYTCSNCETKTQLDFDPKKNIGKLKSFLCPGCNRTREEFMIKIEVIRIWSCMD